MTQTAGVRGGVMVLRLTVHRYRWLYIAMPIYLAALAVVAQLPRGFVPDLVTLILTFPYFGALFVTLFTLINVEADLASSASGYPAFLLRMPVSTTVLALFPIVACIVWPILCWVGLDFLYFHPAWHSTVTVWPGLMFAALGASLQAILWMPVGRGIARTMLAAVVGIAILVFAVVGSTMAESVVASIFLAITFGCVPIAWRAVVFARTLPMTRMRRAGFVAKLRDQIHGFRIPGRFGSPQHAQFWLEWQREGRLLPSITGGVLALGFLPLLWVHGYSEFSGGYLLNAWVARAIPVVPWLPPLLAICVRRSDLRRTDGGYHLFFASRPLSDGDYLRAKVKSVSAGVLATAVIAVVAMIGLLLVPAFAGGRSRSLLSMFLDSYDSRTWCEAAAAVAALTALTWRNQVAGLFVDYLPVRMSPILYPLGACLVTVCLLSVNSALPGLPYGRNSAWAVSVVLAVLLLVKMVFAVLLAGEAAEVSPENKREIYSYFGGWLLAAALVAAAVFVGISRFAVSNLEQLRLYPVLTTAPVPELIAVLLVPLARPLGARLSLELGRHS